MNADKFTWDSGWTAVLLLAFVLIGILMSFVTMWYLNHSKRRARLFELGYSKESDWYKGQKVDFFTANFIIDGIVLIAWTMQTGWGIHRKVLQNGSLLAPNLHINKNYEKFLDEFPFFVRWELAKLVVMLIGAGGMIVGGVTGWW